MSQLNIRLALETRLKALATFPTAYENVDFTPTTGTAYQRVNLLPAQPDNPTLGGTHYLELGVFQITLCYPQNKGIKDAMTKAEAIRAHFSRGLSLTQGSTTLTITRTPSINPAFIDDGWYCVPVSIQYHANIN